MVPLPVKLELATREGTGHSPLLIQAQQRPVLWISCRNDTSEAGGTGKTLT
jgi:hypothetical protein